MSKRKIIEIDEELCDGCGACVTGCAEGALRVIDGKARLVREQFCDGLGDCIGQCPTGALRITERDAVAFDLAATREHVLTTQGAAAARRFEAAQLRHEEPSGGCPGSRVRVWSAPSAPEAVPAGEGGLPGHVLTSELAQWPVQIHLVSPGAPFFRNKELVILSTCAPIASADVHWRFMRGRSVVVGCPKLDRTEGYVEKLAAILSERSIPRVIVLRMEVPCCGGLTRIAEEAARRTGRTDLVVEEVTVGVNGDVLSS